MEKRKSTRSVDEFAIIKAAAWAWYERGSGSEGKPIREFEFTHMQRQPKPSRYKLEAMNMTSNNGCASDHPLLVSDNISTSITCTTSSSSSLFDKYEIERISMDLDMYIKYSSSSTSTYDGVVEGDGSNHQPKTTEDSEMSIIGKGKGRKMKGYSWLMRHGAVCGSRNDVVVNSIGGLRRRTVAGK